MGEDILPTVDYPPMIRGSLRLMLQLKDAFLGSFNLVEEYRDQLLACKHGFTRELVEYQLSKGLAAISRLRDDLANIESHAQGRLKRNIALRQYILQRYSMPSMGAGSPGIVTRIGMEDGDPNRSGTGTAVLGPALPPPINAPDSVEQALHGGLNHHKMNVDVDVLEIPPEIDLATATTESGTHLLPVVDFYRGFFFLQMHFQLIMCQAANYAMPVVTRPMSLSERTFSWPTMPSFGLAANNGSIKDRLLEINTDVLALAKRLHECLGLVREKMAQDRKIESYFMQHTAAQEALRRNLLRGLQAQRVYIDQLESQNDRLAGLATKLDPKFAKSTDFAVMTGSGAAFQEPIKSPQKLTANQNSAMTSTRRPNKGERKHRYDDDDDHLDRGGMGRFQPNEDPSSDYDYHPMYSTGTHKGKQYVSDGYRRHLDGFGREKDSEPESAEDNQESDMNFSASGSGHPAIWVQQGTSTSKEPKNKNSDFELNGKLGDLRGHSQVVDQLLIGVESTAYGKRTKGNEIHPTPSFLNTEHHVPSIIDDVLGQSSNEHTANKTAASKPASNPNQTLQLRSPSTRYSFVESLSPAESVEQPIVTILSPTSDHSGRNTLTPTMTRDKHSSQYRDDMDEKGHSDDTISATSREKYFDHSGQVARERRVMRGVSNQLDTNVNASQTMAKVVGDPMRPRISRSTTATKVSERLHRLNQERKPYYHYETETDTRDFRDNVPEVDTPVKDFNGEKIRQAEQCHLRQVPTVGAAECGELCIPTWVARKGTGKIHRSEDLLSEPKRSAFNKAVMAHRCRLVETILQADEDRLEELISVLLGE